MASTKNGHVPQKLKSRYHINDLSLRAGNKLNAIIPNKTRVMCQADSHQTAGPVIFIDTFLRFFLIPLSVLL